MTWSRFDDGYDEHEKIEAAWHAFPPNPVGLHAMATTACNRWLSDGVIRPRWLLAKLPDRRTRTRMLAAMLELGLFDDLAANTTVTLRDADGNEIEVGPYPETRYLVHDFLDRHDSSVQVKERRRRDAARKARGRKRDTEKSPSGVRADSERTPSGIRGESDGSPDASRAGARAGALPRPDPTRPNLRSSNAVGASADASPAADDATRIWEAYVETRLRVLGPRHRPQFTPERRALIARRLKDWPAADLLDAVQGWQHFPHNRGENPAGQPWCELKLLLRDADQIERFRDKQRQATGTGESISDLAARMNAAHAGTEAAA